MKSTITSVIFLFLSVSSYSQTNYSESEKIATFCKIWGFLKYYHPGVAKGKLDWDKEFTTRVNTVASLNSKKEISNYYMKWINSLGKVKNCKKCKNNIPDSLKFNLDLAWLNDTSLFTNDLTSRLQFIQLNRNQGKNYYVQQYFFVGNPKFSHEKPYKDSVFPSAELRLLGLSRYWNIINYFFPYKYQIGQNWNKVLVEMVPKFKYPKDTISYHLAMRELTVKINDSHAGFVTNYTNKYFGYKWAPFSFKIIDNKAVVTEFYHDSLCAINDIKVGDVFLTVGGQSIEDIIKKQSQYVGASNEAGRIRNLYYTIFNGSTDSVYTTFERNGLITEKKLNRYYFRDFNYKWITKDRMDTCKILKDNVGYINLGVVKPKQTNKYLDKLKNTKALIIDVRNYPNGTMYQVAKFLNSEKKPFVKFTVPELSYPGVYSYNPYYYCGKKNNNAYTGKVILLCNEETQSHAEFTLMALQTAKNVTLIGSQTAGADGNISAIIFPGNYRTYFSGIGIYYPDGRETQRIGIVPDIEVKPTIAGIKAGKDEVLEKAIEIANKH